MVGGTAKERNYSADCQLPRKLSSVDDVSIHFCLRSQDSFVWKAALLTSAPSLPPVSATLSLLFSALTGPQLLLLLCFHTYPQMLLVN